MTGVTKVLVTGADGQVGRALAASVPLGIQCHAVNRSQLDITDRQVVRDAIQALRPSVIINAAAYTAVDKAESERDQAYRVNQHAVQYLAEAASEAGSRLIQISTDYVFDGTKSTPYTPDDKPNPINVYGASKLAGEKAAIEILGPKATVVRTAWVYSAHGSNFVKTMLRLFKERSEVRVVCDQIGTPTAADSLASALWQFAQRDDVGGVFHWTDAGVASWYDFAVEIRRILLAAEGKVATERVIPIMTSDYPTPAARPAYGVLDKRRGYDVTGVAASWGDALRRVIGVVPSDA